MLSQEQVLQALQGVIDPEIGKNIVELGMVQDLAVEQDRVSFTLALTTAACPLKNKMTSDAKAAIAALDEGLDVEINVGEMSQEDKQRLIQQMQRQPPPPIQQLNDIKHVVAVMSGKGGVGKSSVAALLTVALRRKGQRVGLLDADITGPSIPKMLGIARPPEMRPGGIIPAQSSGGINIMSINLLLPNEDDAVIWRGPLIGGAITQFWNDVFWGELDTLVIDLPPGTSDASLTVMQAIPLNGIVLVTSPQDLAGMVVRKAAQMAVKLNIPIIGLVENMSYAICPDCGVQHRVFGPSQAAQTARQIGTVVLGQLPLDPELSRLSDTGKIETYAAEAFSPIADKILERMPKSMSTPIMPGRPQRG
jgi:Mrp family chromosome partitioning ATPase